MMRSRRNRKLVSGAMALALAALLGGCVAYPTYPGYGYGYGAPYYSGGVVAYGGGWHEGHHWHDHDRDWHHW